MSITFLGCLSVTLSEYNKQVTSEGGQIRLSLHFFIDRFNLRKSSNNVQVTPVTTERASVLNKVLTLLKQISDKVLVV